MVNYIQLSKSLAEFRKSSRQNPHQQKANKENAQNEIDRLNQ